MNNNSDDEPTLQAKTVTKPLRPLTRKEQAYLAYLAANPKHTQSEAVRAVYDVKDGIAKRTLENMASAINKRPEVLAVLERNAVKAQEVITEVMMASNGYAKTGSKEGAMYATVALNSANSLLDRVYGKSTTKVEVSSTAVSFQIDLSGMGDDGSTVYDTIIDGESTPV